MHSQTSKNETTSAQTQMSVATANTSSLQDRLLVSLTPLLESLGYELVYLEVHTHREKTIRVFIDHLDSSKAAIGVEDCVQVTRALDEPLEQLTANETVLASGYELEVSSPGVDRPLRKEADFEKFKEREIRLHVFRPLTAEELKNEDYCKRNPKQKNFLGILKGLRSGSVLLSIAASKGSVLKGQKPSKKKVEEKFDEVEIPMNLISKANIEPHFNGLGE